MESKSQILHCMLWSAYGDALAVKVAHSKIKLSSEEELLSAFAEPVKMTRSLTQVVPLIQGCYSSSTQLRLATARAIRKDGKFDVEAFAKVELPVWRCYSILPNTVTKAAAKSLTKAGVQWNSNFFQNKDGQYLDNSGVDCATRIEPHVLASTPQRRDSEILADVLRNVIATHGSPTAIVGACYYALCLSYCLRENHAPATSDLLTLTNHLRYLPKLAKNDAELRNVWLSIWENSYGKTLETSLSQEVDKLESYVKRNRLPGKNHGSIASVETEQSTIPCSQQLRDPTEIAFVASWIARDFSEKPLAALLLASQIGDEGLLTMVGSLVGVVSKNVPPHMVADQDYISALASRMQQLREGKGVARTLYPDLLTWNPPKNEIDYVGKTEGCWQLAGLGDMAPIPNAADEDLSIHGDYGWFKLKFGQHVLVRYRSSPSELDFNLQPTAGAPNATPTEDRKEAKSGLLSADSALAQIGSSDNRDVAIGNALLQMASHPSGLQEAKHFVEKLFDFLRTKERNAESAPAAYPDDIESLVSRWNSGERFEFTYFYGHKPPMTGVDASCFSQWFERRFTIEGDSYATAEHWMMAEKARLFGDSDTLAKIIAAPDPGRAKALGRKVRGFEAAKWDVRKRDAVFIGNFAKFSQHTDILDYLLSTRGTVLVEASPRDAIWGIGLAANNSAASDPTKWRGSNLLGFVLTAVREKLLKAS